MGIHLSLASAPVSLSDRYGSFSAAANTEPAFGLACLAAVARKAGAEVQIVEASAENLSLPVAVREILSSDPDVLGITATTVGIVAAGALAAAIKEANPSIVTIVGGPHVSAMPKETLREFSQIDIAVIGEGELTLADIVRHVAAGKGMPGDLPGTAVRHGNKVIVNPERELIADLDKLPLPAWSLIRGFPTAFHPSPARAKRSPCASIVLTRGCPNQCTFCDRSVFGRRCRAYSPAYAFRLLKDLREDYGVREVLIEDDTFIIRKQNVRELCQLIIESGLDITWSCLGRADRVDLELLRLMKKAGCWHVSYGIESGDPGILKSVAKNLDFDQIRQALEWSRQAGLMTKGFFMIGFPGESAQTMEATRQLALSLPLDDISIMQLTPFPGSEVYGVADEHGAFNCDWRMMNTLNTVFIPRGLSVEQMEDARARMLRSFYLRPSVVLRKLGHMMQNPRLIGSMFRGVLALVSATRVRSRAADRAPTALAEQLDAGDTKSAPLVSVIVVTHNRIDCLRECLASIQGQTFKDMECIVVDNGSTEDVGGFMQSEFPDMVCHRLEDNRGFAGGNNAGMRVARGKYIALINNDAVAVPSWLAALVEAAQGNDRVGAVASLVLDGNRDGFLDSCGIGIALDGMSKQAMRGVPVPERPERRAVLGFSGCACLLRREALIEAGLFDERFFAYCEDTDLSLRIRRAGWQIVVEPGARVTHYYSRTEGAFSLRKLFWVERNHYWVALKNFPLALVVLLPVTSLWRLTVQAVALLAGNRALTGFSTEKGYWGVFCTMIKADVAALRGAAGAISARRAFRPAGDIGAKEMTRLLLRYRLPVREIICGDGSDHQSR